MVWNHFGAVLGELQPVVSPQESVLEGQHPVGGTP